MAIYPVINAPNIQKNAVVVELNILEALIAQYGTPHFVLEGTQEGTQKSKAVHFTYLPDFRTIMAYEK